MQVMLCCSFVFLSGFLYVNGEAFMWQPERSVDELMKAVVFSEPQVHILSSLDRNASAIITGWAPHMWNAERTFRCFSCGTSEAWPGGGGGVDTSQKATKSDNKCRGLSR